MTEVAEVGGEFGEGDLADGALVAQLLGLAGRLGVTKPTVNSAIQRLQRDGFVSSEPYRSIFLTEKGRRDFSAMAAAHADWIGELFGDLGEAEQEALWSRLGKLKASVLAAVKRRGKDSSAGGA